MAYGRLLYPSAARPNHVWSYDFVEDRTHHGRRYRTLNVIDEFTHECLAICINRKLKAVSVIDVLLPVNFPHTSSREARPWLLYRWRSGPQLVKITFELSYSWTDRPK